MEVGQANYGGKKEVFKIQDGSNPYRILPPLGKLAQKGKWSVYYRVEWGYKDSEGKNKPFQCPRVVNRETKMVEVESEAHLHRERLKARQKEVIELLKANPNDQNLRTEVKNLSDDLSRYNQNSKHYLNVVNLEGKIGLLKIGHKAMMGLRTAIDELRKAGQDPLGIKDGVYFDFFRSCPTGNFRDTTYTVKPYSINVEAVVDGQTTTLQKKKTHTMDQAFISRLDTEAYELADMYPAPTAEEVKEIVQEGPTAVDRILGKTSDDSQSNSNTTATTTIAEETAAPVQQTAPAAQTTVETTVAAETPVAQTETPVETASAPASNADMSDEDFLKSIGV